jgi:hypothetical protein
MISSVGLYALCPAQFTFFDLITQVRHHPAASPSPQHLVLEHTRLVLNSVFKPELPRTLYFTVSLKMAIVEREMEIQIIIG